MTCRLAGGMRPRRDERGSFAMFMVIFVLFALVLAGLVLDGGLAIDARQRAADIAEQAARAGADELDAAALRRQQVVLLGVEQVCTRVADLVARYPEAVLVGCRRLDDRRVWVSTRITVRLQLLDLVPGFTDMTVTSQATAHAEQGI